MAKLIVGAVELGQCQCSFGMHNLCGVAEEHLIEHPCKCKCHNRAKWVACNGEAHGNPFIDNCGVCMPYWGSYPVCDNGHKITRADGGPVRQRGFCNRCRLAGVLKTYDVDREDSL